MSENVGNDAKSTLHTGVDDTITSWVVDNPTSGPAYPAVNFRVRLGTAATGELVLVTAASDNGNGTSNWTVQRGVESTTNQAWIAGTVIEHVLTAASLQAVAAQAAGYYPVTQASHGFTQGKAVYFNGTVWALADASDGTKLALGLVGDVATNTFNFYYSGVIGGLTGLTANRYYFVDPTTPGALTLTDPLASGTVGQFSNPVLYSLSTTVGLVLPFRPAAVQASLWPGTSASLVAGDGSNVASARTKLDEVAATTITSLTAATTTAYGTAKLSVAPASATAPIVVGTNDTRLAPAPSAAGKILYDTGSAYAAVAAGSVGQVLQANGAAVPTWVWPGGWKIAYDLDWTAQGTQNIKAGGDTTYTVDGKVWTALNTASTSAAAITNGTGLSITPSSSASTFHFHLPVSSILADWGPGVRAIAILSYWSATFSGNANVSTLSNYITSTIAGFEAYYGIFMRGASNAMTLYGADYHGASAEGVITSTQAGSSGADVAMLQLPDMRVMEWGSGAYSAGMPLIESCRVRGVSPATTTVTSPGLLNGTFAPNTYRFTCSASMATGATPGAHIFKRTQFLVR